MLSKLKSCCINGLSGVDIDVEIDIANGLPTMNIVGLADVEVKESKERTRAAIKNTGFEFPLKRITINLAPADSKKEGTHFDLPIALGLLTASGQLMEFDYKDIIIIGELSLDGRVNRINGVLPMLLSMFQKGYRRVILPKQNLEEAKLVKGMKSIGVESLKELTDYINKQIDLEVHLGGTKIVEDECDRELDFADISGQDSVKRALEVAAAGAHNLLMIGPPGSGKTMAARRLPTILPRLSFEEAIEVSKIYSVSGLLDPEKGMITTRPFRSPHHTISNIALIGGGGKPKPGEVSLSHYGVLFLDELPEFSKQALEVLRQPLEEGFVSISRANGSFCFPSRFMLVASMNPCPCGYYQTGVEIGCSCSLQQVNRYVGKISGPLLDRMDIVVETAKVEYKDLVSKKKMESSRDIRKRVEEARELQADRYSKFNILTNSQLNSSLLKKFCSLDISAKNLMEAAYDKMKLSARGYHRIIKVARTIADLDKSEVIKANHLAEALQYRNISLINK